MYYRKFLEFLKEHNIYYDDVIDYYNENKTIFDYREEEYRCFIGCYYQIKNNRLKNIKMVVPIMNDDKTVLINIHEYVHLLLYYKKIGKRVKFSNDTEVLPILYEKVFLKENNTEELDRYEKFLSEIVEDGDNQKYEIALNVADKLLDKYDKEDDIFKLEKKVRRIVR